MSVQHVTTIAWALRHGLAYYDGDDRLMAWMPRLPDGSWPDVAITFPHCGDFTERAPMFLAWWRAGEALDVAATWEGADLAPLRAELIRHDRAITSWHEERCRKIRALLERHTSHPDVHIGGAEAT